MQVKLSSAQARVVACLVEKSITTPQYYPMTVNAIMAAANQKSCRNPLMKLTEGDVGAALTQLEAESLVSLEPHGGRVAKWRHRFGHQLLLKAPAMAVLVTLMLRGPQTLSELRANAASLGGPDDVSGVQAQLEDLADRAQPLVGMQPRGSGQKGTRYVHQLSDAEPGVAYQAEVITPQVARSATQGPNLEARVSALEARLAELERELGIS